jgi:hypothetical protein
MNKSYKVIWFDDEHESLSNIIETAHLNDIQLIGFSNASDGITDLKMNYHKYDAVLVDGKFYRKPGLSGDAVDNLAFTDVMKELGTLKSIKLLPCFLLSGQTSFTREKNELIEVFEIKRTYDKLNNDDIAALWQNIKNEADKQIDTQIRHQYNDIFELCDETFLGEKTAIYFLNLIKVAQSDETQNVTKSFNEMRSILEILFKKLNDLQLIPDGVYDGNGWINKSSLFLAGKHEQYKWLTNPIHPVVLHQLHNLLQIVQDASHEVSEKLHLGVKQYVETSNNKYLFKSSLFQLMDILIWFQKFILTNSNTAENKKLWTIINNEGWIIGKVIRIADNGFGTFKAHISETTATIIPSKVKELNLCENQEIEVLLKIENNKNIIQNFRIQNT